MTYKQVQYGSPIESGHALTFENLRVTLNETAEYIKNVEGDLNLHKNTLSNVCRLLVKTYEEQGRINELLTHTDDKVRAWCTYEYRQNYWNGVKKDGP